MNTPPNILGSSAKPIDPAKIAAMLAGLPSRKRRRAHDVLRDQLPRMREALARDVAWSTITEGLASLGIRTSVKHLKQVLADDDKRLQGEAWSQSNDSGSTPPQPAMPKDADEATTRSDLDSGTTLPEMVAADTVQGSAGGAP